MKFKIRKFVGRFLLIKLITHVDLVIFNWQLVNYGLQQARGQFKIIWEAKPVEEFINDPSFPDSLRQKLLLVAEVRKYAIDSLGLKDTKNYKTMYDQKGEEIMWVVTASEEFQLKPKEWKFPVVGTVPYKGFFDEEKAMTLAKEIEEEGWDVSVRNPGGWSTLGWFTDPILSEMLDNNEGELASLIIHEMVHATIFVKDSVNFNENLASFVGDRGAEAFLQYRFGNESPEYFRFMNEDHDYKNYVDHVLHGTTLLDSLYKSMEGEPVDEKINLKNEMILQIVDSMDTLSFLTGKKPSQKLKAKLPNNAYFMSFIHYQSSQDVLMEEWKRSFDGDIKAYINFLKEKSPFL
jgi:predicted aminopeptidase